MSKAYRVSRGAERHTTAAEALAARVRRPLSRVPTETFWALQDVSFEVARGEAVGIIGRNGAGKSTLLKLLSRITEPTTGRIELYGTIGSLLEVGTGFHQELTGRENVFLNGSILGMTRREVAQQFDAIVNFAGVERFLDTPVKRYSSGMYVRLAFAVAAHLRTEVLVVDEVLSVGDAEFQKRCLGKMHDVADSGRTVLLVSHNEAAVRRLCSRAILLQAGIVAADGTPEVAYSGYRERSEARAFSAANRSASSPEAEILTGFLSVDGVPADEMPAGVEPEITYIVAIREGIRLSCELLIRDANSQPVVGCAMGLNDGFEHKLEPGTYRLTYRLRLPFLAVGEYLVDLRLAETGIRRLDCVEEALRFHVSSAPMPASGCTFTQGGLVSVLSNTSLECVEELSWQASCSGSSEGAVECVSRA